MSNNKKSTINPDSVLKLFNNGKIPTPKEIVKYLDERVIGQEAAKKRLAVAVYNHYMRVFSNVCGLGSDGEFSDVTIDKSNVLMLGNTGTGKTFLIQNIAQMLGVPCHIHDCTNLTQAGYVGGDVEDILAGLLRQSEGDVDRAQVGIVCLDELDKCASKGNYSGMRDAAGEGVQQNLLKMVEGNKVSFNPTGNKNGSKSVEIDTTNILFIGMGAFVGIEKIISKRIKSGTHSNTSARPSIGFIHAATTAEPLQAPVAAAPANMLDAVSPADLAQFGMIPELIGRFPVLTHTNPLIQSDLARIIREPKNAPLKQFQKLFHINGQTLVFTDDAVDTIAEAAMMAGTGARGVRTMLETVLNDYMFEGLGSKAKRQVVDGEYCRQRLSLTGYCTAQPAPEAKTPKTKSAKSKSAKSAAA